MARRTHEFQTIHSEGGLLPSDLLRRVIDPKEGLEGTAPADYGLPPGERLNEVITQSWNRLRKHWADFRAAAKNLPEDEAGTGLTNDRWSVPLLRELGFGMLPASTAPEINGKTFAINRFFGATAIHLIGCQVDLDRRAKGVRGAAIANPHGLVQDFLNRSDRHLWAILSNGLRFRILRDRQAISRQSYLEFNLEAMFEGEVFADFVLLWVVAHSTRFAARDGSRPESCWLEQWTRLAEEQGTRALGDLRQGVEHALARLGQGLVEHPRNTALRDSLRTGKLSLIDFHGQLLRVVYRLIFLFVAEDRTLDGQPLLHPRDESEIAQVARKRYSAHYSAGRLRDLAGTIRGSRHGDLWRQFNLVVGALSGDPRFEATREALSLPSLGSYLWSPESTVALNAPNLADFDGAELSNADFLEVMRNLAFTRQNNTLRPVDYKNLGAEELGGVYESLLALTPQISGDGARFTFAEFSGNQRKMSGSYYTPDALVQCLLDSALEPVIEEAIRGRSGAAAEKEILDLKVCDPAVGSGHFLVGAAHRLARHLARIRAVAQGEGEPSPSFYQHALRDVIGRCLYGVDINPMAAELCRVSLWLEALEPGKPLSFLDHHIRVGNSLLGATPELISGGLPDEAFTPLEGDDKKVCTQLRKQNRAERDGADQDDWVNKGAQVVTTDIRAITEEARTLDSTPDDTSEAIQRKADRFNRLIVSPEYKHAQQLADAWCAAFLWSKTLGTLADAITTSTVKRLATDPDALTCSQRHEVERLAAQYRFFHWHLAFPEVFAEGGFNCLLGNPPWVRQELLGEVKVLLSQYPAYSTTADLSVLFVSLSIRVLRHSGLCSLLLPNKWMRAENGSGIRRELTEHATPILVIDFGHTRDLFPGIDVFPVALTITKAERANITTCYVKAHDEDRAVSPLHSLVRDMSIAVPARQLKVGGWQLERPEQHALLEKLQSSGPPLSAVVGGRIFRGVLTGLNEAFVISPSVRDRLISDCPQADSIIKPWLTGADVKRWAVRWSGDYVIFSKHGIDISRYPAIEEHLTGWRAALTPRSKTSSTAIGRKPGSYAWYEIQDNAAYAVEIERPKILVPCIAYYSEFAFDQTGLWPNNKVIAICTDDLYVLGILNSRVMWWLMSHQMLKMKDDALSIDVRVLADLPIPEVSNELRRQIREVVEAILEASTLETKAGDAVCRLERDLNALSMQAFALNAVEEQLLASTLPPRDPVVVACGTRWR
jgi:hypothetical protein